MTNTKSRVAPADSITISHPAFGPHPLTIGSLKRATFIFGANGSGKTTLSRALREAPSQSACVSLDPPAPRRLLVFNRDYIQETVLSDQLDGILVIADDAHETRIKLEKGKRHISGLHKSVQEQELKSLQLEKELQNATSALNTAAWNKRRTTFKNLSNEDFNTLFSGTIRNKSDLISKLWEINSGSLEESLSISDIETHIQLIKATGDAAIPPLLPLSTPPVSDEDIQALLTSTPELPSESRLRGLIERLHLADWINEGLQLSSVEPAARCCPFCQQSFTTELRLELEKALGTGFARIQSQAQSMRAQLAAWQDSATENIEHIRRQLVANQETYKTERASASITKLETCIFAATSALEEKAARPSQELMVESCTIASAIANMNAEIEFLNRAAEERNELIAEKSAHLRKLKNQCYATLRSELETDFATHKAAKSRVETELAACKRAIESISIQIDEAENELSNLRDHLTSSSEIASRINRLLKSVGFDNFKLSECEPPEKNGQVGYRIVRHDGSDVGESLSEGEATFVALAYYMQRVLNDSDNDANSASTPTVAVIDDPVSSMDANIAHFAASLLRDLAREASIKNGHISQVIILTHNAFFYRQVAANLPAALREHASFGLLSRHGQVRKYTPYESIPVRSSYALLWDQVPDENEVTDSLLPATQNDMRRIVETYFASFGSSNGVSALINEFKGEERVQFASLISWMHSGSHSVFDELEHVPTQESSAAFVKAFYQLFRLTGNDGHLRMMLEGRRK